MPDRTITLSTPKIRTANLKEGENVLRQNDSFKLLAEVKKGKVVGLSGVDAKGKALKVSTLHEWVLPKPGAAAGEKLTCYACIDGPFGRMCYEIDCDDLPKRKVAAAKQ